jgi:hypothetical protein
MGEAEDKSGGLFGWLRNWVQGGPELRRDESAPAADPTLEQAIDSLLFPSETDAPIEVFAWPEAQPFSPDALRSRLGLEANARLTTMDIESFFAPAVRIEGWFTPERRAQAERFQQLLALLKQQLSAIHVYQFGQTEMPTVVLGHDEQGRLRGIKTVVVET